MAQPLIVGSPEHKEAFCRFFLDTHVPYDPADMRWPDIDAATLEHLRSLPFWGEAIATERATAQTIQAWATQETDPLLRQAVALQGYEETRHAAMIHGLVTHYAIPCPEQPTPPPPSDAEWAFLCTGYSECFDAFFTFALFALARDSGFFPPVLVNYFEPIMQEEARHILFFVNWEAYSQAQRPLWQRPRYLWRGALGRGKQAWHRLQTARGAQSSGDFTIKGHQALQTAVTPRSFLSLCLAEHARRMGAYDARLLRPRLVPTLAKALCTVLS